MGDGWGKPLWLQPSFGFFLPQRTKGVPRSPGGLAITLIPQYSKQLPHAPSPTGGAPMTIRAAARLCSLCFPLSGSCHGNSSQGRSWIAVSRLA